MLEPFDDNQEAEEMAKYIAQASITQSVQKLHQAMLHSLRQDINATVVRATGRTMTQTLTISLTVACGHVDVTFIQNADSRLH